MATFRFDARAHTPTEVPKGSYDPLSPGWYQAQIIDSELKDTRAGDGQYIKLTWEVIDGPNRGRRVWQNLNVRNPSAQAEQIGISQLHSICSATGVLDMSDTSQLHNKPCRIKVTVRKSEQYGDSNEVKGVERLERALTPPPSNGGASTGARPPWRPQ